MAWGKVKMAREWVHRRAAQLRLAARRLDILVRAEEVAGVVALLD
jgi:hypothetical protein